MIEDYLYFKNKFLRHIDKLDKIKDNKDVSPVLARIDVTNRCNHNCIYCMYKKSLRRFGLCDSFNCRDAIKRDYLISLICSCKKIGIKAIMFTGGGEPTIYPNFKSIMNLALIKGLEVGVITNGGGIDKEWINLLMHKKFEWIRISLDAANKKTWQKVHCPCYGNSFDKILGIVRFWKSKSVHTRIEASFVINDKNWKEVVEFTKLCKMNKFNGVRISFTYSIKKESLYYRYKDQMLLKLNEAQKLATKKFYVTILKSRLESLEIKNKNYERCYFSFFSTSIGADLKVYPCCMTKYASKYCIGYLRNGKMDKKFIKRLSRNVRNIQPKRCPVCWYDEFNRSCDYYCKSKVNFENFIN
jgi:MoaA/NifB/PqqE/SkfB family radical SAM enzyme